jgi:hypothetical protein
VATNTAVLNLTDDDPEAVAMVVQYLYHLDYPHQPSVIEQLPPVNGYSKDEAAGDEDTCESPTAQHMVPDEPKPGTPSVASQDDRDLQPKSALVKPAKAGRKGKKKRKTSTATAPVNELEHATESVPDQPLPEADADDGHYDAVVVPEGQGQASGQGLTCISHNGELVVHAKVFSLSQKYDIEGLKGLALEKFRGEAEEGWDKEDFLLAVREVYHSSMDGYGDKRMREAVTDIVCQHPELLDKPATQSAIKDLQLNYDVLMRMRRNSVI